jgi:hypothetical protein
MNPINRIGGVVCGYEQELHTKPDVIYMTRRFFESILLNPSSSYMLPINGELPDIFGMKVGLVDYLGGSDFQCFKSDHLKVLGDRFKKDSRYNDYTLEFYVPRFASTDISYIANEDAATPIPEDQSPLKKIKITAAANVLNDWVNSN